MYEKYKNEYYFINFNLHMKILELFKNAEMIHKINKTNLESKKKFINYWYILYKIFEKLHLGYKYNHMLDLPNNIKKYDIYYNEFFND